MCSGVTKENLAIDPVLRGGARVSMASSDEPTVSDQKHISTCSACGSEQQPTGARQEKVDSGELMELRSNDADFIIYKFKLDCPLQPKPDCVSTHDWTNCPYAHHGEKARRRNPRTHSYVSTACPDFRKGSCKRGDACPYAHGVFECWLHPAKFRTQLCKEGAECTRKTCFFAHGEAELRPVVVEEVPKLAPGSNTRSSSSQQSGAVPSRCGTASSFNSGSPISVQSSSDSIFAHASPLQQTSDLLSAEASSSSLEGVGPSIGPLRATATSPDTKLMQAMASMVTRLNRLHVAPPVAHGGSGGGPRATVLPGAMPPPPHPRAGSLPSCFGHNPLLHTNSSSLDPALLSTSISSLGLGSNDSMLSPQPTPPYSPAISPQPASRLAVLQQLAANQLAANQIAQQQALLAQLQLGVDNGLGCVMDHAAALGAQAQLPPTFDAGLVGQALAQSGVPPTTAAQLVMAAAASAAANHAHQQQQQQAHNLHPSAMALAAAVGGQQLPSTWPPAGDLSATLLAPQTHQGHQGLPTHQGTWDTLNALQGLMQAQRFASLHSM